MTGRTGHDAENDAPLGSAENPIHVPFADFVQRAIATRPAVRCKACWGTGDEHYDGGFRTRSCRECRGTGRVAQARSDALAPVLAFADQWHHPDHGGSCWGCAIMRAAASSHPTGNQAANACPDCALGQHRLCTHALAPCDCADRAHKELA